MQTIQIPVEVEASFPKLAGYEIPFEKRMKIWTAISLYIERKASIGKAAELAEMAVGDLEAYMSSHNVFSHIDIEEVLKDIEFLKSQSRL
jgi:predicted HTH domain antitoxin